MRQIGGFMKIKIRRKPTYIDILRMILGIGIIVLGFVAATGVIPDTASYGPAGLVIFGILFFLWGFYPIVSKKERQKSKVLEAMDRMQQMPESPGQLKHVRVPGTNIIAGYTKEELAAMRGETLNKTDDSEQTSDADKSNESDGSDDSDESKSEEKSNDD